MPHLYLGQWEWQTDESGSYWSAPGNDHLGALDMRSIPHRALKGGTPQGYAFFSYDGPRSHPSLLVDLGEDLDAGLKNPDVRDIQDLLGVNPSYDLSAAPREMLRQLCFVQMAGWDPTGATSWKPLRGRRQRDAHIYLGGFGAVYSERPDGTAHPAIVSAIAVFREDYRRNKSEGVPLTVLRKWTGRRCLDLLEALGDTEAQYILPPEYADDGWLPPATSYADNFNRSDEELSASGWTELAGDWEVQSNVAVMITDSANDARARYNSDLSGDDHYCQIDITAGGSYTGAGVTLRHNSSADTCYQLWLFDHNDNVYISEITAGSRANLTNAGVSVSLPDSLYGEIDGSDLSLTYAGAGSPDATASDSSITGNLRCGMSAFKDSTSTPGIDDWEAADLGGAAATTSIHHILNQ